jgi:hypothetical protein
MTHEFASAAAQRHDRRVPSPGARRMQGWLESLQTRRFAWARRGTGRSTSERRRGDARSCVAATDVVSRNQSR